MILPELLFSIRTCTKNEIEYSKLCFLDMKIMSLRNGDDSVNNESAGRVIY